MKSAGRRARQTGLCLSEPLVVPLCKRGLHYRANPDEVRTDGDSTER